MSVLDGTPADGGVPTGSGAPAGQLTDQAAGADAVAVRAAGLQLIGEQAGSGYRTPPSLVRRADGQTLQLTKLLYLVLESVDGQRSYSEIAAEVSARYGRSIDSDAARMLAESKLRPLGLLRLADGSEPQVAKANPLLALRFRWVVSDPAVTRRITAPFRWLFNPLVVAATVLAFLVVCKWVLLDRGLGFAAHQAFESPGLLLAVFAITLVSAGFHEFGHAAAARYGGATPGAMGAGLYLVWPAFYTDVTDSYRLGRAGRLRTDLGGLYFNALLSVAMFGLWALTGWDALLLVIGTQLIQMIRQLPPLVRFDGYHILADVTGVPDLFHQIRPTLAGLLPWRRERRQPSELKTWAKAVVTLWVLLVVPLMLLTVLVTVLSLPRIITSAAVSFTHQWALMLDRFGAGDVLGGLAKLLAVIAVGLPVFGIGYLLTRSVKQLIRKTWRATEGKPGRRATAAALAAAVLLALGFAWWPHGNYRPIGPAERGTMADLLPASYHADAAGLAEGRQRSAQTLWPADAGPPPSADKPVLSLVLVPRSKAPDGNPAPVWVFPFNRPAPPGVGDNQSLAVNTRDGTVVYDVAFAMVWADSDTVLNKNEAYAFASCRACQATAVSFQVVLIVGQANVVIPQNISAAVNYNCLSCLAQALAVQLVVTLPGDPSAGEVADLNALWSKIEDFSKHLRGLSFSEIQARLASYERQILDVLKRYAPATATSTTSTASPTTSPSTGVPSQSDSVQPSGSPVDSPSQPESSVAPDESATASESGIESASPTESVSSTPSATTSDSVVPSASGS
jgi:putative peptide zinc metalloprotease protein